jgi:hypothetical protein
MKTKNSAGGLKMQAITAKRVLIIKAEKEERLS